MTVALSREQQVAVSKIAGLTILNAMVFQEVLSAQEPRVDSLHTTLQSEDLVAAFAEQWQHILQDIDYVPIFKVARELLLALPADADVLAALSFMGTRALAIVGKRAALRHDLMGRVYHRLLVEAKFLGTYYTSIPAATILLKLALTPSEWDVDWGDLQAIQSFRVADLACGTGTLLMATAEAVKDNYVNSSTTKPSEDEVGRLHRLLMEDVLYGCDVLPSALHLTASTLAMQATDVTFNVTHLYSLPHGGDHNRLGSIEFLGGDVGVVQDMFGSAADAGQVTGAGHMQDVVPSIPMLDLCVMNPPFTRSAGENLLFGSVPEGERKAMQKRLQSLLKAKAGEQAVLASVTAGLGSVFAAVGDKYVKRGGRLALVLPKTLLSGVAWEKTRALVAASYELESLIVSHDPTRWNFSDNTSLSEVLLVARKRRANESPGASRALCANLWRNPTNSFEALAAAQQLIEQDAPAVETGQGALTLTMGESKIGEAATVEWQGIRDGSWMLPCSFAQTELTRAAYHLAEGRLYLPGHGVCGAVPVARLGAMGELGPDRRDIHDGFVTSKAKTAYPALWGHVSADLGCLATEGNSYLSPLPKAKKGRPLRKADVLWPRAGRVQLVERLRLNTYRLVAVRSSKPLLSNVWWPFKAGASVSEAAEKALVLWLNSTLGLLSLLVVRDETEGAWIDFKKPTLAALPVLDVVSLPTASVEAMAAVYDAVCSDTLLPLSQMADDPIRQRIDDVTGSVLDCDGLGVVRELLGQEPVVCLKPLA